MSAENDKEKPSKRSVRSPGSVSKPPPPPPDPIEEAKKIRLKGIIDDIFQDGTTKLGSVQDDDVRFVLKAVLPIFQKQHHLLHLTPPMVVGDLLGDVQMAKTILRALGRPPHTTYLFLGNYINGNDGHDLDTIIFLFAFKAIYPNLFFLLRGNHEYVLDDTDPFWQELKARDEVFHSHPPSTPSYSAEFNAIFSYMPVAATLMKKVLCVHGGISPELTKLDDLKKEERPFAAKNMPQMIIDILKANPNKDPKIQTFRKPKKGERGDEEEAWHEFGLQALEDFCLHNSLEFVVRGNQKINQGFERWPETHEGVPRLITLCSCTGNRRLRKAALMLFDDHMKKVKFTVLESKEANKTSRTASMASLRDGTPKDKNVWRLSLEQFEQGFHRGVQDFINDAKNDVKHMEAFRGELRSIFKERAKTSDKKLYPDVPNKQKK